MPTFALLDKEHKETTGGAKQVVNDVLSAAK